MLTVAPTLACCLVNTRRQFLVRAPLGLAGALAACRTATSASPSGPTPSPSSGAATAGAPPAFNTAPPVGPEVTPATFAEAEKLEQVTLTSAQRAMAAASWRTSMAPLLERRTGPRKIELEDTLTPATVWNPLTVRPSLTESNAFHSTTDAVPLPATDADIAFAPVTQLARWIESRALTSERLTRIYLDRIHRYDAELRAIITLTPDVALDEARRADAEIAAGKYRGPLHGIPYGVKDLLDTANVRTTYGAEPFRDRVPKKDSVVVARLREAGAVLVAKLSMGALALNDIWFGGQTMNPWLLEEGSSGSSAGPGAATAAGLVAFAIGSETGGSILSPSLRCGLAGLRPTFGRVARTGAMTLCWSLDKLGPMARGVEDTMLVLRVINGGDAGDPSSVTVPLGFDGTQSVRGLRVGYIPAWMKEPPATDVDRATLDAMARLGMVPTPVSLPDWPYDSLNLILFAEAAASFEELTLSGAADQLRMQVPDAWPNLFREARFLSAVDFVQADRLRRKVADEMKRVMEEVDLLLVPTLRDEMLVISNNTGHPALAVRTGFVNVSQARSDWAPDPAHPLPTFSPPRRVPYGVTLIGRLFDEGTIVRAGMALERSLGVARERPPGF